MRSRTKFILIVVLGLLVLMLASGGAILSLGIEPETITKSNTIHSWFVYRVIGYVVLLALWKPVLRFVTRPTAEVHRLPEQELKAFYANRDKYVVSMSSQWWKIALFLGFYELVIVLQLGL